MKRECENCVFINNIGVDGEGTGRCLKDKSRTIVDLDMGFHCFVPNDFEFISKCMIAYLNKNKHPHVRVIIDSNSSEILEGLKAISTDEFIAD